MKISEAFVKSIRDQALGVAWIVPGKDQIKLSLAGPQTRATDRLERGLVIDVDLNVGYHSYCSDQATVAAYFGLRKLERLTRNEQGGPTVDCSALLDQFSVQWCEENEHLQVSGCGTVHAAAQGAWRMGELAICLQATAYAMGLWDPSETGPK